MRSADARPGAVLRPDREEADAAWAERVRMSESQVARLGELDPDADFYTPVARRFGQDPRRRNEPALDVLLGLARDDDTWLDIGAGGGRYALPLALRTRRVIAVEPSAAMREVLASGMEAHGIRNVSIDERDWPRAVDGIGAVDVALMAHVGYGIEGFGAFVDAAEVVASRCCVVIMRVGSTTTPGRLLWQEIHGEPRVPPPALPELLVLLVAHGATPEVALMPPSTWSYDSRDELLEALRLQLRLRAGSAKDARLVAHVEEQATRRHGQWALDWTPMQDGIVTWSTA